MLGLILPSLPQAKALTKIWSWFLDRSLILTYMYIFSPHRTAETIKSLLLLHLHAILSCRLLPCWLAGKCRHKIQSLKLYNIYFLCKRRKNTWAYVKHVIFILWQLLLNKRSKMRPTSNWMMLSLRQSEQNPQPGQIWSFTRDKVSKHDVCQQGTCETWRRLGRLNKETAACYFIRYYIGGYPISDS